MKYLLLSLLLISCTDNSPMFASYNHEQDIKSKETELSKEDYKLKLETIPTDTLSNSSINQLTGAKWDDHLALAAETWDLANGGAYDFKMKKDDPVSLEAHKKIVQAMESSIKFHNEVNQNIEKNKIGKFELNLGIHQIEYFADRLLIKAKKAGYNFAVKKTFVQNNRKYFKATLGPFESYEEAETAQRKIKAIVPDSVSEINKVK